MSAGAEQRAHTLVTLYKKRDSRPPADESLPDRNEHSRPELKLSTIVARPMHGSVKRTAPETAWEIARLQWLEDFLASLGLHSEHISECCLYPLIPGPETGDSFSGYGHAARATIPGTLRHTV